MAIIGGLFLSIWAFLTSDFVSATNGWIYGVRGSFARTFSASSIVFGTFTLEILRRNLQHREHIATLWTMATWSAYFASLCQISTVFVVFASRTCAHGCFMVSLSVIANQLVTLERSCTKNLWPYQSQGCWFAVISGLVWLILAFEMKRFPPPFADERTDEYTDRYYQPPEIV